MLTTLASHGRLHVVACDRAAVIGQTATGRCVVAGHSSGGLLAQLLAVRHPDLVCGLVLVDPAHEDMTASLPRPLRPRRPGQAHRLVADAGHGIHHGQG